MDNIDQRQTLKTELTGTILGNTVTISYEKEIGANPGIPKAINANVTIKNPDATAANPLPPLGGCGVNFGLTSYVNGKVKEEDVTEILDQLKIKLLEIANA